MYYTSSCGFRYRKLIFSQIFYYCAEIKSHTNPIISLIMYCMSQKVVNFVGKLPLTLIEPDFDTSG